MGICRPRRRDRRGGQSSACQTASGIPYQVDFCDAAFCLSATSVDSAGGVKESIRGTRIGDDLSWTMGKHAFKGGLRMPQDQSNGFNDPNYDPVVTLGAGNSALGRSGCHELLTVRFTGLTANNATLAKNILYDLSGSVTNINQAFGVMSAQDTVLAKHSGNPEQPALELPE